MQTLNRLGSAAPKRSPLDCQNPTGFDPSSGREGSAAKRLQQFGWSNLLALLLIATVLPNSAQARLTQQQLTQMSNAELSGAPLPRDTRFTDGFSGRATTLGEAIAGRPTVLLLVDYTCRNVCDPMFTMTLTALRASGLRLGGEVGLVLVGLDPRDGADAARAFVAKASEAADSVGIAALVGDAAAVRTLTNALNYRMAYDAESDSFVHQAVAILVTPDGRPARVLSPLTLNGRDLRLSLVEASAGRIGSLRDRLALLCYGFDAAKGIYTPIIRNILSAAALLTILVLAGGVALLLRRERRA